MGRWEEREEFISIKKIDELFLFGYAVNLIAFLRWPEEFTLGKLRLKCDFRDTEYLRERGGIDLGKINKVEFEDDAAHLETVIKWQKQEGFLGKLCNIFF
eukprot:GHVP01064902.1.p1 GENE.GHVP01064902.1~~GHVP01064902.1.p1  ORF type:complete len:100 (-),score=17.07 GHVP01064902.1:7-306(-)